MTHKTVDEWLRWQEQLHPSEIELGLDRCRSVFNRITESTAKYLTVTVAGTNGKGSTAAFLEQYCVSAGLRTGLYSSPHLHRYHERIRIDACEVDDSALCEAFERVENARDDVALTYFEFGTLAATVCFDACDIEIAILEVGLGGKLDAVNLFDADVSLVTSIALDHQDWLGDDRESIAEEKAGIFRKGKPAVCGDRDVPVSLINAAERTGSKLLRLGNDFDTRCSRDRFSWIGPGLKLDDLPLPAHLIGSAQLDNVAVAIMALAALSPELGERGLQGEIAPAALLDALRNTRLPGRFQIIPGDVEWVLDVAHNPAAAHNLAACLRQRPVQGKTTLVLGMLSDKDVCGVVSELGQLIDKLILCSLPPPRGFSAAQLTERIPGANELDLLQGGSVRNGCEMARSTSSVGDRIVVTGSFLTVASALELLNYANGS